MWELCDSKLSDLESFDNIGTSFGQNLPVIKNDIQGPWEDPHHWK